MSWKTKLNKASFRNVEFQVPEHTINGGRRVAVFQFPGEDRVYVQDLGKKGKNFSLTAFVLGDDYFTKRDNLIKALDKGGKGTLIHPYYGRLEVSVIDWSSKESISEGRKASFEISFAETGSTLFPEVVKDTQKELDNAVNSGIADGLEDFLAAYAKITGAFSAIKKVVGGIQAAVGIIGLAKRLFLKEPKFAKLIKDTIKDVQTLAVKPEDLFNRMLAITSFGSLPTSEVPVENAKEQFKQLIQTFKSLPDDDGSNTLENEFNKMQKNIMILVCCSLLGNTNYSSFREAKEFRDLLLKQIDKAQAEPTTSDVIYENYRDLRKVIQNDIDARSGSFARVQNKVLSADLPALVISYNLYGDIEKETDIINRNKVQDPAFIPGGKDIEVLIG